MLAAPMGAELGLTRGHVFGAFAWSMVISGLLAPWAGRTLDRFGGRVVLVSSALVGALGFLVLARAHSFAGFASIGAVLGGFSAPSLVTRALAPFGFALLMTEVGTTQAIAGLVVVSLASCAAYAATTRAELP